MTPEQEQAARLTEAAKYMDWIQVRLNGGPPCFYLCDDGRFCGRAERWQGHGVRDFHDYVSLEALLSQIQSAQKEREEPGRYLTALQRIARNIGSDNAAKIAEEAIREAK